jgi:predicted phage terminase large subunit-like protein
MSLTPITAARRLEGDVERSEIIGLYEHYRGMGNEWLRRQIIDNRRIDILAEAILGYTVQPFHRRMLQFQFHHPDNLQLVFRGAGKSTMCTITKCIWYLLADPNLRIVIASKTAANAEGFLKEVKTHFETNERLAEVFGPYYDARKVNKWDNREIEVLPRTEVHKEASVTCVGFEGTIVSKHYDVEFSDDLVDEDNARTLYMRDKLRTWYYKTLDPTIEPRSSSSPYVGDRHRLGTRYHYDDLYGYWIKNELKSHHQIIPALNDAGQSPWPEKWPPEEFARRRAKAGLIIFNSQYQCDTEAMKGEVFQYDDCQTIEPTELPAKLKVYIGVDLAISLKESADHFAIVVIGKDKSGNVYVLDYWEGQLRFSKQTAKILEYIDRYKPERVGIETNQYQKAQAEILEEADSDVGSILVKLQTDKDKVSRAWKLTPMFENKRVFFVKNRSEPVRDQLVLFPGYRYKDLFDAFDNAVRVSKNRRRRARRSEPGVM